jgi:hypothetical protein
MLGELKNAIDEGKDGERCADYEVTLPDGRIEKGTLAFGDLKLFNLPLDQQATVTLQPAKQVDLGEGPGQSFTRTVKGGVVGLMLDGRGRPLQLPTEQAARVALLTRWYQAVGLYPKGN